MSLFPRIINVTGSGTGVSNVNHSYSFADFGKGVTFRRKFSYITCNTSNRLISVGNVELSPAATASTKTAINIGTLLQRAGTDAEFTPFETTANTAGGVYMYSQQAGTGAAESIVNSVIAFVVSMRNTDNTRPSNTTLSRVLTIAPAGSSGSNVWGGYREWNTRDATINVWTSSNTITYVWDITSNSPLPWQFRPELLPNVNSGEISNTGAAEVIFCY